MKMNQASVNNGNSSCHSVKKADVIAYALIAVFGLAAVLLRQRTADFMGDDVFYADAAQSLLQHGFYGVNGISETTQPPGLAGILAALFAGFGYSYAVSVAAMAVFETLGFLAAYELLRRRVPRLVAAGICVMLMSSPVYFSFATRLVFACFPYFFTTMIALLSGEIYDRAASVRARLVWGGILTAAVAASLLIATGTIALLGALVAVIVATAFRDLRLARTRLLKFLPVLLVGVMVQGVWMHRTPAPLEWSLPGYPASYLNQIKVKNGNDAELGMATWGDIPGRVAKNVLTESDNLAQVVLRHGVSPAKVAVVIIPILLAAMGWFYTVWKSGGTDLAAWYFAGYQAIYLLWPWRMETRFLLPIAPLACLYIWLGLKGGMAAARARPRVAGMVWFPLALLLGVSGTQWIYSHWATGYGEWPDELVIPLWLVSAAGAFRMAYTGKPVFPMEMSSSEAGWFKRPLGRWCASPYELIRYAGCLVGMGLVLIGVVNEGRIARENLSFTGRVKAETVGLGGILAPEVEAGVWLRSNTPPAAVVMARHWPTVCHYALRKSAWFAPISDPVVLLEGIRRLKVDYIVVVHHASPYYLPDDDYCFDRLLAAHAENFHLVRQRPDLRIFKFETSP